ncbi:ATP-binding/permease protein CydC [Paenibacillus cisolokensis]|uniref:ATP-binding/permease protein CydC n=1 Tax=Paenibacillus cisolokensis TaxID=1658519 RepID=A0ABQ4NCP2_9BACL|nr:thiol reductant ABC exporter subunit CydD [Paenibacillus cisolokensis]GIQ65945.1 ATP-binding/permease protein CydC [Paenibacillus cisolokensis]
MDKAWFSLGGIKQLVLKLTAVSLLQAGAVVAQAMFLAQTIDLLFEGRPLYDLLPPLALFVGVYVARQTLVWIQQRVAGSFAERRSEEERGRLVSHVFERGPRFVARENSGRLVTLAMEGADRLRTYLEMSIPRAIDTPILTLAILLRTYWLDVISGLILTVAMPVIIVFFIVLGLAARKQADRQWGTFRQLAGHFADSLRGLETLLALGRSRTHGQSVVRTAEQYRKAVMRTLRVAFLSSLSLDVFSMLAIASVAVGLGLRLMEGNIEFGSALAVLLLAPEFFAPIKQLGADYHASLDGKEAWASLKAVYSDRSSPLVPEPEDRYTQAACRTDSVLTLDHVGVANREGRTLLQDISLQLLPDNRWIGIAGASGAGKTTLLGLIGGLIEASSGEIRLDETPMHGDKWKQWRSQVAYIPQHPHLFSLSLADNIRFYEPGAADEVVERAIEAVGLSELVQELPDGMKEPIGEGGRALSGGQAQRVALARALVSGRPIVLLDEPTAHLDVETEWELKQTLLEVLADKRVILATHRLHWMREMQEVWVMDRGRIVERGTHEELCLRGGVYARMLENNNGGRHSS